MEINYSEYLRILPELNNNQSKNEIVRASSNQKKRSDHFNSNITSANVGERLYINAKIRAKKLEDMRKVRNEIEMKECTFNPFTK